MTAKKKREEFLRIIRGHPVPACGDGIQTSKQSEDTSPDMLQSEADLIADLQRKFDELFGVFNDDG